MGLNLEAVFGGEDEVGAILAIVGPAESVRERGGAFEVISHPEVGVVNT